MAGKVDVLECGNLGANGHLLTDASEAEGAIIVDQEMASGGTALHS